MRRLCLLLLLLAGVTGCGADRPAVTRATAVAIGALGSGLVTSGWVCADRPWEDCRPVAAAAALAVLGTALAAGATAFLRYTGEAEQVHQLTPAPPAVDSPPIPALADPY